MNLEAHASILILPKLACSSESAAKNASTQPTVTGILEITTHSCSQVNLEAIFISSAKYRVIQEHNYMQLNSVSHLKQKTTAQQEHHSVQLNIAL